MFLRQTRRAIRIAPREGASDHVFVCNLAQIVKLAFGVYAP